MTWAQWIHAIQAFVAICGSFSVVCVAAGWLIKIVKGVKKPKEDIDDKLERDYKRINQHDKEMESLKNDMSYLKDSLKLLLENDKVMLEHMRTNNATGEIAKREKATFDFLNEHQK